MEERKETLVVRSLYFGEMISEADFTMYIVQNGELFFVM